MRGHRVDLFDPQLPACSASCGQAGAGMLAPYSELQHSDALIFTLGHDSIARWSRIVDYIESPVFMQKAGTIVVAHSQDEGSRQEFVRCLTARFALLGITAGAMEILGARDLWALEPSLSGRFHSGILLAQEGQIDNRQLMRSMLNHLDKSLDCQLIQEEVLAMSPYKLRTSSGERFFDYVVDCRGLKARNSFKSLRGVRGELIEVSAPDVKLSRPIRLMHPRYPLYITPRADHHFLIGATSLESEDFRTITVQSTLELLSAAYSVDPGFAEATILENRVNCRPALTDNLPSIAITKGQLAINGLYRHGFLLAPRLANEALNFIEEKSMCQGIASLFLEEERSIASFY
jgi:glycine oxidase